jgi:hypothetical protein
LNLGELFIKGEFFGRCSWFFFKVMTATITEFSPGRKYSLTFRAFLFKLLTALKTEVGVLRVLKLAFRAIH